MPYFNNKVKSAILFFGIVAAIYGTRRIRPTTVMRGGGGGGGYWPQDRPASYASPNPYGTLDNPVDVQGGTRPGVGTATGGDYSQLGGGSSYAPMGGGWNS